MCGNLVNLGSTATAILLVVAAVLVGATPAPAQNLPTEKDLVGTWDIKLKKTNTKIATIELMQNGQFKLVVGMKTFPAAMPTKWKLDGANFQAVYESTRNGRTATQVYMRGKIDNWTRNDKDAFFEL